ncbi:MAG TPA: hypothetical protein VGS21_07990 [Acidimicrobiales bacterium]|nr:hypothetical protein [Acidimicrobiales bacterium]
MATATVVTFAAIMIGVAGIYVAGGRVGTASFGPSAPATRSQIAGYIASIGNPVRLSAAPDPSLPPGAVVNGVLRRPIVIDGGRMGMAPPPGAVKTISRGQAATQAQRAESGLGFGYSQTGGLVLARVWIASDLTRHTPSYGGRVAWVAFTSWGSSISYAFPICPPLEIVVLDAATGRNVLDFADDDTHLCPDQTQSAVSASPVVSPATEVVSIPWTILAEHPDRYQHQYFDWLVRYTVPMCADAAHMETIPPTAGHEQEFAVYVSQMVDEPSRCDAARSVTIWIGPEWASSSSVIHEPLGLVVRPGP